MWIGAAALAAVIVMLLVGPSKKDPAPTADGEKAEKANAAKTTAAPAPAITAPSVVPPGAAPATVPAPTTIASAPSVPAIPTPPRDPDDPVPPVKPIIPADRENTLQVLDNIQFALRDYRTALGGNPVGTNAEITSSLLGNNLKQVKIPLPDGTTVNAAGEMCDLWGTPLFFHQQSGTKTEIRSAGPDQKMHTADDVMM